MIHKKYYPGSWVGFDLDGTLAHHIAGQPLAPIGKPITPMVELVKEYLDNDVKVKVFTARVAQSDPIMLQESIKLIQRWCLDNIGLVLPVTCVKDFQMDHLYDDRAIQVVTNTGMIVAQ